MRLAGWKAWYAVDTFFSSETTDWEDLPATGLQVLMLYFDEFAAPGIPNRRIIYGNDFYFRASDPERTVDRSGFDQTDDPQRRDRDAAGPTSIKRGSVVSDVTLRTIVLQALADQTVPRARQPVREPRS